MRNFVIAVDGVPAPDLGIFASQQAAARQLNALRSHPEMRRIELSVVAYERKRLRRAVAA